MFYLTTHSTHFIYGYMASDIWLRTIPIVRKETRCRHIGYSYRLTARVLLYAPSHRQDNTYHDLCYTSRGALTATRNTATTTTTITAAATTTTTTTTRLLQLQLLQLPLLPPLLLLPQLLLLLQLPPISLLLLYHHHYYYNNYHYSHQYYYY